jgi:hypothetical protein
MGKSAAGGVPSLLLTSKQVKAESRPVLLSHARLVFPVDNWNFQRVRGYMNGLTKSTAKPLSSNDNVVIQLNLGRYDRPAIQTLQTWLVYRKGAQTGTAQSIEWHYEVSDEDDASSFKGKRHNVNMTHELLQRMHENLVEDVKPEMALIVAAYAELQEDLQQQEDEMEANGWRPMFLSSAGCR